MPAVTVAVVSWNTRDLLARCLDALAPEAEAGLAEVWVVDNASADGSAELVAGRYGWARLIASPENLGFGPAVNRVAERTRTPWLAVANADVALRPGALAELLEAGERDPGAGAIAPRLVLPDGTTQHSVFGFPTVPAAVAFNLGLYRLSADLADRMALVGRWDATRSRRVPWAVGAFLLVRRTAWEAAGGFDDRQWMYAEDLDLGWRLRAAGWTTRYEPRAVADHESGASTRQAWGGEAQLSARWQRSTYEWMARRRGPLRTRVVAGLNVLGASARYALAARSPGERTALAHWVRVHRSRDRDPTIYHPER